MKNIIKGPNCAATQIGPSEIKNFLAEIYDNAGLTAKFPKDEFLNK